MGISEPSARIREPENKTVYDEPDYYEIHRYIKALEEFEDLATIARVSSNVARRRYFTNFLSIA